MYDLILQNSIKINNDTKIPAGALAKEQGTVPIVHRKDQKWQCDSVKGKFISEVANEVDRLRFAQILNSQEKFVDSDKMPHSFSLFENLSDLETNDFENLLQKKIGHLEAIAANPVLDLKRDEIKLSISRVKRFSTRSLSHLAGHSEDWQSRTFTAVVPNRMYTLIQEDKWSTYENILFVSLCKMIDKYLTTRINSYSQIEFSFDEIFGFYNNRPAYYEKTRETYDRRLNAYFTDKGTQEQQSENLLKSTKRALCKLQGRLRALWASKVFIMLEKVHPISLNEILPTNLLQNHQHYRYLIVFRNAYLKEKGKISDKSSLDFEQEQLHFCSDLNSYVQLCIQRIFRDDGYLEQNHLTFVKNEFKISSTIKENEVVLHSVCPKSIPPLKFYSMPCDPGEYYMKKKSNFDGDTIIIYPAPESTIKFSEHRRHLEVQQYLQKSGSIVKIGISPLSIFSEEVIASVIMRWLKIPIFKQYPIKINKIPKLFIQFISCQDYSNCLEIQDTELSILKPLVGVTAETLKSDFDKFKLQARKRNLILQPSTIDKLIEGHFLAKSIETCLVCGKKANNFKPDSNGNFNSECIRCKTKWGKNQNGEYFFRVEREDCDEVNEPFPNLGRYGKISCIQFGKSNF